MGIQLEHETVMLDLLIEFSVSVDGGHLQTTWRSVSVRIQSLVRVEPFGLHWDMDILDSGKTTLVMFWLPCERTA